MIAVEQLLLEHGLILRLLDQLSTAADRIIRDDDPPREFIEGAITFCREFADKAHHYKEEYVMFGLLAERHDGVIDGEIERHRSQHEHCRNLVNEIAAGLSGYEAGVEASRRLLHRSISEYVTTLRSHIRSENEVFFPMVEDALTEEDDMALIGAFKAYEEKVGDDLFRRYTRHVTELADKL